tara:strand:+ start:8 stop:271 length:264 start_codon:yes stop_codon:yes gene_type:complete
MEICYVVLIISIIINIILIIGVRNLIKQTEQLEDNVLNIRDETRTKIENTLQQLRSIDIREVFEKDDEVGVTFTQLKNIIEELNKQL